MLGVSIFIKIIFFFLNPPFFRRFPSVFHGFLGPPFFVNGLSGDPGIRPLLPLWRASGPIAPVAPTGQTHAPVADGQKTVPLLPLNPLRTVGRNRT
jgi:hypothetical protein